MVVLRLSRLLWLRLFHSGWGHNQRCHGQHFPKLQCRQWNKQHRRRHRFVDVQWWIVRHSHGIKLCVDFNCLASHGHRSKLWDGTTDLWGASGSLTVSNINSSSFGFVLSVSTEKTADVATVYTASMTVYSHWR